MAPFGLIGASVGAPADRTDPYHGFNFRVEVDGIVAGGFSECSGLQIETEYQEYRQGGENGVVRRFVTGTKYPPFILKHGLSPIDGLWKWYADVLQAGETGKVPRKNVTVYLANARQLKVMWWTLSRAYPVKWTGPELRADSASVAVESVELVHEGLKLAGTSTEGIPFD